MLRLMLRDRWSSAYRRSGVTNNKDIGGYTTDLIVSVLVYVITPYSTYRIATHSWPPRALTQSGFESSSRTSLFRHSFQAPSWHWQGPGTFSPRLAAARDRRDPFIRSLRNLGRVPSRPHLEALDQDLCLRSHHSVPRLAKKQKETRQKNREAIRHGSPSCI
ncbi:hypothetical protein VTG60DRAFT_7111 [Thermothelomyces hinnuleus]